MTENQAARPQSEEELEREREWDRIVATEKEKELKREEHEALIDFLLGRDTEGASRVAAIVAEKSARVAERSRRADLEGDPLRLNPKHRRVATEEKKAARARRRKGLATKTPLDNLREAQVVHHASGAQKVQVRGHHFRGLNDWQKKAIDLFLTDYMTAFKELAGIEWGVKVDNSIRPHSLHLARIEAQGRLSDLERHLGARGYTILKAYAVDMIGVDQINKSGGPHKSSISDQIKNVIDQVSVFYGIRSASDKGDKLIDAINRIKAPTAAS